MQAQPLVCSEEKSAARYLELGGVCIMVLSIFWLLKEATIRSTPKPSFMLKNTASPPTERFAW